MPGTTMKVGLLVRASRPGGLRGVLARTLLATVLVLPALVVGAHAAESRGSVAHRPSSPSRSTIVLDLQGMRSDDGVLRLALFASATGFPDEPARARRASIVPIRGRRSRVVWSDVEPGRYAVAVLHDENRNGKLDKSWLGMPTEGSGFSRDATGSWGPPDFDDAALEVPAGRVVRTVIPVRYF